MADGDLAYSHVPSQGGALLCETGGGALLYRVTRTYWLCRMEIVFEIDEEEAADTPQVVLNEIRSRLTDMEDVSAGAVLYTMDDSVGYRWHIEWYTVSDGAAEPFAPAPSVTVFRLAYPAGWDDGVHRGDATRIPNFPLYGSHSPRGAFPVVIGPAVESNGGIAVTGDAAYQFLGSYRFGVTATAAVTWTRLPHHPLCTHAAQ